MTTRKKWAVSVLASGGFLILGVVVLVLNPGVLYAHQTLTRQYTIFHDRPLNPALLLRLGQARNLVQTSEVFDNTLRIEVCLNDGSRYPSFIQTLWSPAFAWSFYNKVVLNGEVQAEANRLRFRTYAWNLTSLLAHEMTHCYQFHYFGWWRSNPQARYPTWKWEGYAEYVARHPKGQQDLQQNTARLQQADQTEPDRWNIQLSDSSSTSREYFTYFVLTEYCLDVKRMTFQQVLQDTTSEKAIHQQLVNWYQHNEEASTSKIGYSAFRRPTLVKIP
jgi:hypothetical protein